MPNDTTPLLQISDVSKRFPGVRALHQVSLSLAAGEVLAVIGENGAGKSTLMKILAGVQAQDSGTIAVDGKPVAFENVAAALRSGVALIHQELNLASNLDVGANIFLGREPLRMGLIDRRAIDQQARKYLEMVGLNVEPRQLVSRLTIGRQQLVEIAKALSVDARVLIMDEPTSSLSAGEAERLFEVIRQLRAKGVSIIYISHRLAEVEDLADRVVVLRDGENAGELNRDELDHEAMVRLMVGRDVSQFYARQEHPMGDELLKVERLVTSAWPRHALSFSVRAGEMVGLAGLVGAGRTELLRALFGVDPPLSGSVRLGGQTLACRNTREAIARGMALVPEDRKQHGLVLEMSVRRNTGLAGLRRFRRSLGFLNQKQEDTDTEQMIEKLSIRTPGADQITQFLSGGNQQKVVLGKWLALGPKILLLDEPTRGIDIGAKEEIYQLMESLAEAGMAILFASSEMEEVLGMSDRVLVMHEGRITGELGRDQLSEEAIMRLATGTETAPV